MHKLVTTQKQNGFTILELMITITIIGLISIVVLASAGQFRVNARNAGLVSQMVEYEKALNLYYADFGFFPTHTTPQHNDDRVCLGQGAYTSGCWPGANFSETSSRGYLEDALVPDYLASLPGFDQGNLGSPAYIGCTGTGTHNNGQFNQTQCNGNNFSMLFLLEGINQGCARYTMIDGNYLAAQGDYTLCRMNLDNTR